ncbi:MAG TPA: hypothetical protein EYH09_01820 [Candidatus Nanopusillus sp.]|nr:hypothetical protein [Candidatus Nanopusillus sp.]HIP90498.1 hypothetical protein [Candidatus Nanopusillus sp.]
MVFQVGSLYYVLFLESSKPDVPTLEILKKIYPNIYAFPVAGSIDGIVISEEKLPLCNKENTLEMILIAKSPKFLLKDRNDYAFLYFESNIKPGQVMYAIREVNRGFVRSRKRIQNYMLFKSENNTNKYLLFIGYKGNITLDKLWNLIYDRAREYGGVYNDNTYIVFTTRFARKTKKKMTVQKIYA